MEQHDLMYMLHEVFSPSLPRLGPGDDFSTSKALDMALPVLSCVRDPAQLAVLDIGCGVGAQTLELARNIDGTIAALDNHQPYLDELMRRAAEKGVADKITPLLGDMNDIGMERESLDLIWAEGSLFVMGFVKALAACYALLKPGGVLAASEMVWFEPDPPQECRAFMEMEYPALTGLDANLAVIEESGFEVTGHFSLPESSWLETYYRPIEERLPVLLERHAADPQMIEFISLVQMEIDTYRQYSTWYGYEFFIMRRT